MEIAVEAHINAPMAQVWMAWNTPEDIVKWNYAIPEWCCPRADLDLKPGGAFNYRMEAKDGSAGFDYRGEFTKVTQHKEIQFNLDDGRAVTVQFFDTDKGVRIVETFEIEDENTAEQQRQGWQAILNNFKSHVEDRP